MDEARAMADKLRKEGQEARETEAKEIKKIEDSFSIVKGNTDLAVMYKENATVGSEHISSESPTLKVHTTGKSKNELPDGSEPQNGNFFYVPSQTEYKTINCHILTISAGFRADGLNDRKNVYNQIMAGLFVDPESNLMKPFIMYFQGLKLGNLWKFGKDIRIYTKNKEMPIPMFVLSVRLSTEKQDTKHGYTWMINFEVLKDENDFPLIVTDLSMFTSLRANVSKLDDLIDARIQAKEEEEIPF